MNIVVISPHPDDAALSMGGFIARRKSPAVLITCFSRSCSRDRSDAERTTKTRSFEDEAYAEYGKMRLARLGLADTSIRTNVGLKMTDPKEERQVREELTANLWRLDCISEASVVFAPLAVGGHLDHVHCRQAAMEHNITNSLIFYEDLPYAQFEGGPFRVHQIIRRQHPDLREINVHFTTDDMKRKMRGLDFYKSQIHPQWRKNVEQYASAVGKSADSYGERYWTASFRLRSVASILSGS